MLWLPSKKNQKVRKQITKQANSDVEAITRVVLRLRRYKTSTKIVINNQKSCGIWESSPLRKSEEVRVSKAYPP